MARARGKWSAVFPLMILVGIGSCVMLLPKTKRTPAEELAIAEASKLMDAQVRCQNETESRIADPEGFEPEPYGSWRVLPASADDLTFHFKAQARNAFGALIWAEFKCRATFDGTYWTAEISQG